MNFQINLRLAGIKFNNFDIKLKCYFRLLNNTIFRLFQNVLFAVGNAFLYYVNHFKLYSSFCASHSKAQKVLHPSEFYIALSLRTETSIIFKYNSFDLYRIKYGLNNIYIKICHIEQFYTNRPVSSQGHHQTLLPTLTPIISPGISIC